MFRRSLLRVCAVLASVVAVGAANYPDALCLLPHWPRC